MPPKREAGAIPSPTPGKMLKINTVPLEAGPMEELAESTYSPFLNTEEFEGIEDVESPGIRTDTISLLMKIEQLQAQLKYERRCRILAERELRDMKGGRKEEKVKKMGSISERSELLFPCHYRVEEDNVELNFIDETEYSFLPILEPRRD